MRTTLMSRTQMKQEIRGKQRRMALCMQRQCLKRIQLVTLVMKWTDGDFCLSAYISCSNSEAVASLRVIYVKN